MKTVIRRLGKGNAIMIKKVPYLPIWFEKSRTYYAVQVGKHFICWCYLMGGGWEHWFQFNRFSYYKVSE